MEFILKNFRLAKTCHNHNHLVEGWWEEKQLWILVSSWRLVGYLLVDTRRHALWTWVCSCISQARNLWCWPASWTTQHCQLSRENTISAWREQFSQNRPEQPHCDWDKPGEDDGRLEHDLRLSVLPGEVAGHGGSLCSGASTQDQNKFYTFLRPAIKLSAIC